MEYAIAMNVYDTCYSASMSMEQFMNSLSKGIQILEEGNYSAGLGLKDLQASNIALQYNASLLRELLEET